LALGQNPIAAYAGDRLGRQADISAETAGLRKKRSFPDGVANGSAPLIASASPPIADRNIAIATRFIRSHKFHKRRPQSRGAARREDKFMHTIVRSYSGKGAKELFGLLEKNKTDVEKTLRSVKGLVSYTLVRSADGGFSVTVCNDKAGTEESLEKAKDWIAKNAAGTGVGAAKVSEGSVVLHLK
jgi:hypothetical protein